MNAMKCMLLGVACLLSAVSGVRAEDEPEAEANTEQQEREQAFADLMSGSTLVGYFTTSGTGEKPALAAESYQLRTVKKLNRGDYWLFEYQYGDQGKVIPLTLQVKWAGDTPVITLTKAGIPGVGTFSARVVVYEGEYAGTWSASDHGGVLFGRVDKAKGEEESTGEADEPAQE